MRFDDLRYKHVTTRQKGDQSKIRNKRPNSKKHARVTSKQASKQIKARLNQTSRKKLYHQSSAKNSNDPVGWWAGCFELSGVWRGREVSRERERERDRVRESER
jgi:hypothetical protein